MRAITRRTMLAGSLASVATWATACGTRTRSESAGPPAEPPPTPTSAATKAAAATRDPRVIASRATVPVLCWHQLRDWRSSDTAYNRQVLICPPAAFRAQLDALSKAGHTTISPDQYLEHLTTGAELPPKPVLLTFDDAQGSQITTGLPELQRRGMVGTFFIMTVVLGKKDWMSVADLRRLDAAGMTVASHTYDHHEADAYSGADWRTQIDQPRAQLEKIIGKPVRHFAYPYGAWNQSDFPHLASAGFATAFQLGDRPMDPKQPLFTLRRTLVNSTWSGPQLLANLRP